MRAYVAELWRCRHFWLSLVRMDLQMRYRRSFLGIGWSLLHPIGSTMVLCVVFHKLFHVPIREFIPFLMTGLAWWGYVTGVISRGCQCFVEAESYIRQHSLPMAIYPLRTVLGATFHLLVALAVVVLLTWTLNGFGNVRALPALLPGIVILLLFGWGIAVLAGYVNTMFRDVQHVVDLSFQALFYLTPIIYPHAVLTRANLEWVVRYNPLAYLLQIVRGPLIHGQIPPWPVYAVALTITLFVVAAATLLLGRLQRRVVLYL